jgi:hypothetical protein
MLDIVFYSFIIFAVYLTLNSFVKLNIVVTVMNCRRDVIEDKKLVDDTKIVDYFRCFKYVVMFFIGVLLCISTIVIMESITLSLKWFVVSVCFLFLIFQITRDEIFCKKEINETYSSIKEQWKTEKKVSNRHDEEVTFVRAYDEVRENTLMLIGFLISVILYII